MMMAISTGFQVISAISQGNQKQQQYEAQAQQLDYQNRQAAADAQAEREAGQVRADKVRKAGKLTQSKARAALAASGVAVGAGTPVKIAQEIFQNAESDAQQELLSGNYAGARGDATATGYAISAANSRTSGENARTNGYLRAGGSLLSAGSSLASGWTGVKYPQGNNPDEWNL